MDTPLTTASGSICRSTKKRPSRWHRACRLGSRNTQQTNRESCHRHHACERPALRKESGRFHIDLTNRFARLFESFPDDVQPICSFKDEIVDNDIDVAFVELRRK